MAKDDKIYCTTFCNHPHRLSDGKPLGHVCYVLPTEALYAEQRGDFDRAQEVLNSWTKRREHHGLKVSAA